MNKLMQRVVTAAVLLVAVLAVLFLLPRLAALTVLGLFLLLAAWEWSAFLRIEGPPLRVAYVGFILLLMVGMGGLFEYRLSLAPVLWIGILWWLVALVWVSRYPTGIRRDVAAFCGIIVLLPAWVGLLVLLGSNERGPEFVLLVLSVIWAADIGAYFTGRWFGRTKLAPKVSPGKTWEGVAGGLIAAAAAAALGARWLGLPVGLLVPAGMSVAAISIVGDLTVSMFKRNAGLKDSGHLFPGHGGVLDRIDSITAGLPLFALEAAWIGIIVN
jgi:phosphatidate cytidylyltransferase